MAALGFAAALSVAAAQAASAGAPGLAGAGHAAGPVRVASQWTLGGVPEASEGRVPEATAKGLAQATIAWWAPLRPLRIERAYDPPAHNWLPGHRGVDLAARPGQAVRAAGPGKVAFAGQLAGRGVVSIDHGALRTTYEPVAAEVSQGDRVAAGQLLGRVAPGSGHCGSGDCVHFGVRRGRIYLDPRFLLHGFRPVLRPL